MRSEDGVLGQALKNSDPVHLKQALTEMREMNREFMHVITKEAPGLVERYWP